MSLTALRIPFLSNFLLFFMHTETISALITRSVRSHFLHPLARYPSLITSVRLRQYSPAALDKWVADKVCSNATSQHIFLYAEIMRNSSPVLLPTYRHITLSSL